MLHRIVLLLMGQDSSGNLMIAMDLLFQKVLPLAQMYRTLHWTSGHLGSLEYLKAHQETTLTQQLSLLFIDSSETTKHAQGLYRLQTVVYFQSSHGDSGLAKTLILLKVIHP